MKRLRFGLWGVVMLGVCLAPGCARAQDTAHPAVKRPVKKSAHGGAAKKKPMSAASKKAKTAKAVAQGRVMAASAESKRLTKAFAATSQLRPLAQSLANGRSSSAFAAVQGYAASHPGEGAQAAYLSLGHAYAMDHRYGDAADALNKANVPGGALADYAAYLGAQADLAANRPDDALRLLNNFAAQYPQSVFAANVPVATANAYLAKNDGGDALKVLQVAGVATSTHADVRLALGRAYQASGDTVQAAGLYRGLYINDPLSPEAATALTQLNAMGMKVTPAERKQHADALFNAKQYAQAAQEYAALAKNESSLSQADRDGLEIYRAVCDLRLKKLTRSDVTRLPVTNDDTAALKMYLQSEIERSDKHFAAHDQLVSELLALHPGSRWLEEALYSGGNMYLVQRDSAKAISEYRTLTEKFPRSTYAPSAHWHEAWLEYRARNYAEAARLMDEQVTSYPAGTEVPAALYWRGRLYEDVQHDLPQALNYYRKLNADYCNTYYAWLGRQRIASIGPRASVAPAAALAAVHDAPQVQLTDVVPQNDPHVIKARLLANAALNEYIRPEIQMSAGSAQWGALAEAQIYQSFGETSRALQSMKRGSIPYLSVPVSALPVSYWQLLFPRPYWDALTADAQVHALDPYLVASLIRQESEFNPSAVSRANAYGLMQLLPSTGKSLAKKQGERRFTTSELLDPLTNLKLGTADLKRSLDAYGGQTEYALAAYNAGDTPVRQWIANGGYRDVAEWVESIPYTETREYVQSILRGRELYHAIYSGK